MEIKFVRLETPVLFGGKQETNLSTYDKNLNLKKNVEKLQLVGGCIYALHKNGHFIGLPVARAIFFEPADVSATQSSQVSAKAADTKKPVRGKGGKFSGRESNTSVAVAAAAKAD